MKHEAIAQEWHSKERPNDQYEWSRGLDDRPHPFITAVETASNCPYMLPDQAVFKATREHVWQPRVPEPGYALAHLLNIDPLTWTITSERNIGSVLCTSPGVHEWWNGAKFVAVPEGGTLDSGIADGPDPSELIHKHWQHFLEPVDDGYVPITPFKITRFDGEWFACYPKKRPDDACMDEGDPEFHVCSVERVGDKGAFKVDEYFFLRYTLEQVRGIMPRGANAYEIVDISEKDSNGLTTVAVQFYVADVDTSRRLPRTDEIARDYERLMEVYAQ
jgi:hypothetical protein